MAAPSCCSLLRSSLMKRLLCLSLALLLLLLPGAEAAGPGEEAAGPGEDFQEELVLRPLLSGDISASFQFRTHWNQDFQGGDKGRSDMSMSPSSLEVQV